MKLSQLKNKVEKAQRAYEHEANMLVAYREKNGGGITVGEIRALESANILNLVLAFIEDLAYDQEIELDLDKNG